MSYINSILRIIEGTKSNDVDKVIRYATKLLNEENINVTEDEYDEDIDCIKEMFDPKAGRAVMDCNKLHKIDFVTDLGKIKK